MIQRIFSGAIAALLMLAAGLAASQTAWAAEIILYDNRNFGGEAVTLTQSTPDLGNFDNEASSVKVISGTWILYRNDNYGVTASRPSLTLPPGDYPNLSDAGFPRNRLSSVRLITDDVVQPPVTCAQGTRPGPGGQCVCQSGYVATGQDPQGRLVCGPAQAPPPPGTGQVAPPPSIQPDPRQPPGSLTPSSCTGPYHMLFRQNGRTVCKWTCGRNSRPDAARNRCSCNPGYVGRGKDRAGRVRCLAGAGTVAPPRQPAGEQFYSMSGRLAIQLARQRGYTFTATKTGPITATCKMEGDTAVTSYRPGTTVTGIVSPAGCTLMLFGGRELASGWSFHRLEVLIRYQRGDPGLDINLRYFYPAIRVKFHDPGQGATEAKIDSVMLRGPAGRDWREAFQR